jgi:hypothetical protein
MRKEGEWGGRGESVATATREGPAEPAGLEEREEEEDEEMMWSG